MIARGWSSFPSLEYLFFVSGTRMMSDSTTDRWVWKTNISIDDVWGTYDDETLYNVSLCLTSFNNSGSFKQKHLEWSAAFEGAAIVVCLVVIDFDYVGFFG